MNEHITLTREEIIRLAERVEVAQTYAHAICKLTEDYPGMTLADGYAVQLELRHSYLSRGHRQVGWKVGLTSRAKMVQMGVDVPSIGFLTDRMARPDGSVITVGDMVHPRVEPEIAFITSKPLSGRNCTAADVLAAVDCVLPAIEVIDSRFTGFKFDLASVVADNSSSARFVVGGQMLRPSQLEKAGLDLTNLGVVMEKNGEMVGLGSSAAVLGNPAEAIALLVRVLADLDEELPAGSFVMSGSITEAIAVKPGDHVIARFQGLGSVSMRFGS